MGFTSSVLRACASLFSYGIAAYSPHLPFLSLPLSRPCLAGQDDGIGGGVGGGDEGDGDGGAGGAILRSPGDPASAVRAGAGAGAGAVSGVSARPSAGKQVMYGVFDWLLVDRCMLFIALFFVSGWLAFCTFGVGGSGVCRWCVVELVTGCFLCALRRCGRWACLCMLFFFVVAP